MAGQRLYAVEYRNMRTAVHGLFVYENAEVAYEVDDRLSNMAGSNGAVTLVEETMFEQMRTDVMADFDYSEIDFRKVVWDDSIGEYVYRDSYGADFIVVNTGHDVHDIYGL